MKVSLYKQTGEQSEEKITLPKEIFCVKVNPDLLHQVITSQYSNQRQGTAHTKDRSERSGSGRKPWPQKGTGRARHGSRRSPIWRKGGVVFGPRNERNYKKIIPKKMRRKALLMALSAKAKDNELIVLPEIKIAEPKTRLMAEILNNLPCKNNSVLIVTPEKQSEILLASRNIPKVKVMRAGDLNALEVLRHKYLIILKKSIEVIKKTFVKTP